jgi:hypothetical protein
VRQQANLMEAGADHLCFLRLRDGVAYLARPDRQVDPGGGINPPLTRSVGLLHQRRQIFDVYGGQFRECLRIRDGLFQCRVAQIRRGRRSAALVDPYRDARRRTFTPAARQERVRRKTEMGIVFALDEHDRIAGGDVAEQRVRNRPRIRFGQHHVIDTEVFSTLTWRKRATGQP